MIQEIENWIDNPKRGYKEGCALYERYGKSDTFKRVLRNSSAKYKMSALVYELRKLSRLSAVAPGDRPQGDKLPATIVEAKQRLHELYQYQVSSLRELYDLGEENSLEVMAKREAIISQRKPAIALFEALLQAKEDYFNASDKSARQQALSKCELLLTEGLNGGKPKQAVPELADLSKMPTVKLVKKIHATKVSIKRKENMLLFQQYSPAETENPMPECPKRTRLEEELASLRSLLPLLEEEAKRREVEDGSR